MSLLRRVFLFFTLLLSPAAAFAVGLHAPLTVSAKEIPFNQTVTVTVTAEIPTGVDFPVDAINSALTGSAAAEQSPFVVADIDRDPPVVEGSTTHHVVRFVLEPWIAGQHAITFGTVAAGDPKDPVYLVSDIAYVKVQPPAIAIDSLTTPPLLPIPGRPLLGIEPETWQKLKDDADHDTNQAKHHLEAFERHTFPWTLTLCLAVLAAAAFLWRRYGRPLLYRLQHSAIGQASPRERALEALEKLLAEDLPSQQRYDSFYVALTAIVRRYIEDTFGLKAPEHTTEEFLREAGESNAFDTTTQQYLGSFLGYADLVKFAQESPTTAECEEAIESARRLIQG